VSGCVICAAEAEAEAEEYNARLENTRICERRCALDRKTRWKEGYRCQ